KIKAVMDCPQPTSIRLVELFLGFANFWRFVRNFSSVAAPIPAVTQKTPVETSDITELQVQTVRRGDETTIRCGQEAELKELVWYKESLGKLPQYVVRGAVKEANFSPASKRFNTVFNTSRFSVDEEKFDLSIKGVKEEDIGIYFCGNGKPLSLQFISGTLLLFAEEKTDHHPPPEPDKHQCSVQTVTLSCSGEHSVYWIRHGSGEPHPGIIYTPRYTSDECESSSETDSSTQSCVYKLPKRNLSLSDAGTYYCAVAACGPETKSTGKGNNWTVVALITSNAVSVIVMLVLGGLLWKKQQKGGLANSRATTWWRQHYVAWYKQSFGKQPQLIVRSAESKADIRPARAFAERFRVTADEGKFDLSIINTVDEDTGTYFCVKLKDYAAEFGSGTLLLFTDERSQQSDVTEVDVKSGESVTLQCSVASLSCSGEHSVYWYRHGSGESHPGIIYTHGNTNSPCTRSSETDSSTQSCVYKLPKRNLSLSDAGTYYCAVAACGQILFGDGTKLSVKGENIWIVPVLTTTNVISVIVIVVLAVLLLKNQRKGSPNDDPNHPVQVGNTDALNYAALKFNKKPPHSRTPRVKEAISGDGYCMKNLDSG
ncbi:hypothetical protein NFI96_009833, partial [Prochilodus magdalenae]